jgi:hypothetical protein
MNKQQIATPCGAEPSGAAEFPKEERGADEVAGSEVERVGAADGGDAEAASRDALGEFSVFPRRWWDTNQKCICQLLEALKLENTALRAVLVHSVKQGARILDPSGELVGASTSLGLTSMNRDGETLADEATAGEVQGEDEMTSEETARAVEDVYAALDRLGARTHVYARTIVPLATDEHSAPSASHNASTHTSGARSLNGPMVPQSSMRTVQHPQQPLQQQPLSNQSDQQQQQQHPDAFPTSNLPPFPVRLEAQQEQQQSMEPMAEIDPSLENTHQGEGLMDLNLA